MGYVGAVARAASLDECGDVCAATQGCQVANYMKWNGGSCSMNGWGFPVAAWGVSWDCDAAFATGTVIPPALAHPPAPCVIETHGPYIGQPLLTACSLCSLTRQSHASQVATAGRPSTAATPLPPRSSTPTSHRLFQLPTACLPLVPIPPASSPVNSVARASAALRAWPPRCSPEIGARTRRPCKPLVLLVASHGQASLYSQFC